MAEGPWSSNFFEIVGFSKFNASSENARTFAVSIDKGFEFYRKIIELRSPTLQVPRSGATTPLRMAPCFAAIVFIWQNCSFAIVSIQFLFGAAYLERRLIQCRSSVAPLPHLIVIDSAHEKSDV